MLVYGDSAAVVRGKHVLAVAWAIDPAFYSNIDCVSMTVIVSNILSERALEERDPFRPISEPIMANWARACRHVLTVFHREIMQRLVPSQSWEAVLLSELVRQLKGSNPPLL